MFSNLYEPGTVLEKGNTIVNNVDKFSALMELTRHGLFSPSKSYLPIYPTLV